MAKQQTESLVTSSFACACKGVDVQARTVDVVMSTPRVDRHGDRVELDWDLDSFKSNPVVLWAHDSRDMPLGRAENVRVERGALVGRIRFASAEANPKAQQVLKLFEEGVLNAVSVGFIPHSLRFEKEDDAEILVLSGNELVELSVTPTPANPDALVRVRSKALEARNVLPPDTGASNQKTQPPAAPAGATNEPATEKTMSESSSKELIAKVEDLTAKNSALAIEAGSANGRADTERARADKAEKALADLEPKVKALETEKAAFEAQAKSFAERAEKAEKAGAELEAKSIDQEVEALIGKKITPAEKPLFVDLRKTNKDLFEKMIAQRADMKLEVSVTESGAAKNGVAAVAGDTANLLADVKKAAGLG